MAMCVTVDGNGFIVHAAPEPDPSDCYAVVLSGADYRALTVPDFTDLGITSETVLLVAAWGFGAVLSGWCLGLAAGWSRGAINRA